ncbi:MAG: response regulator [Rhizobiaceae bacterium]|nr:response regulator [Rhizobiaceae bacterium]MCV0407824.1 response regulator [Rhizobiaceae bacterium]
MNEPLKVIIVEDEALLAMELEAVVEEAGHRVVGWATNAREARELADTTPADVALVDIHLTDGPTGVSVAEYMKERDAALVVFLTANPKRLPDKLAGAAGVIAKPYTVNGINDALKFLEEGVRRPPPVSGLPVGFTLAPDFAAAWAAPAR